VTQILRLAAAACLLSVAASHAHAHAIAGVRVFPVSLTVDDPGVADEATLPQIVNQPGSGPSQLTQFQWEYDKRITPTTALIYNQGYDILTAVGLGRHTGWENPIITGKWQAYVNPEHEFIASLGVQRSLPAWTHTTQIGGSAQGATTPTVYFGKGLGDVLPGALRPLAITGEFSATFPDRRVNANNDNNGTPASFRAAATVQYSLPYLQSQVKDYGLPAFVNRVLPIFEVNYVTPTTAPSGGVPMKISFAAGAIYMADTYQIGAELLIPGNAAAGKTIGAVMQVHFFLDDIFPDSLGKPVFE